MKKIKSLSFILVILLSFALANAAAEIRYTTENQGSNLPIVANVPFIINLEMSVTADVSGEQVKSIKLYTQSGNTITLQEGNYRGSGTWLPSITPDDARPLNGQLWLYSLSPSGDVEINSGYKRVTSIKAVASASGQITLPVDQSNEIGKSPSGIFPITSTPLAITASVSSCGDGVVNTAVGEVCDDGDGDDATGCSNTCAYVNLRYTCSPTGILGNLKSDCIRMDAKTYLTSKLTALINGQCYPQTTPACTHPAALYATPVVAGSPRVPFITYATTAQDPQGKLDPSEKIYMIAQIGVALREFFIQTVAAS